MSVIDTKNERMHQPPQTPPFAPQYWYNGFSDDTCDPAMNGMPFEPLAFREKPIRLVSQPGFFFYRDGEKLLSQINWERFDPYGLLEPSPTWALEEGRQLYENANCITSVFELRRNGCTDLAVIGAVFYLGLKSMMRELLAEPHAKKYFRDTIIAAVQD